MSSIHLDPAEFQPLIDAAVETALRRLQAERPRDAAGKILLPKREAADVLGVSQATVDRLRKAGLPAVKLDGKVLFRPGALEAWAAAREAEGGDLFAVRGDS